ncbi:UNVERIFIED_CONTAM: hypothetical protein RMT77_008110 [Armadillidium vulgare]|nr:Post-GPI attachment to proteins factor 3 [Armadillidium vulgare]
MTLSSSLKQSIFNWMVLYFLLLLHPSVASNGDNSNQFQGCFHTCHFNNCSEERNLKNFYINQNIFNKLLFWSCEDECKYECMWHTTNAYLNKGWEIPQFFGKWPFKRFLGLQEPASVAFSVMNFLSHCYNFKNFRKSVPPNAPFYYLWHLYFLISLNAWFWSVCFHARDTSFTEKLDYFSAFSMVLSTFLMLLLRASGKLQTTRKILIAVGALLFYLYHIWYLSRNFDYDYNMKVNVIVGLLNGFGWLFWSWKRPDKRGYLFWCHATNVCLGMTLVFELLDFSPILWTFDAHSLWHLSTVILPFFWYRFIEGDCYYLLENMSRRSYLKKSA